MKKISIIVPCYNEEQVVEMFYNETKKVVNEIKDKYTYEMIFVDDGSNDNTLNILKKFVLKYL